MKEQSTYKERKIKTHFATIYPIPGGSLHLAGLLKLSLCCLFQRIHSEIITLVSASWITTVFYKLGGI